MDSSSSSSPSHHKSLNWLSPLSHLPTASTAPMFFPRTANEDDDDSIDDRQNNNAINESALGLEVSHIPKQLLFEKPLTPSDVGKLNRLVIPKQHAEKCFPLNGSGGGESAENGLLLSFQDDVGKSWRFRYSYWNSSQSYVLTKGWSRFVKEKRLDAGDIVVFSRHCADAGRLFIGWKRRNSIGAHDQANLAYPTNGGGSGGWSGISYTGDPFYRYYQQLAQSNSNPPNQQPEHCPRSGSMVQNQPGTASASVSGNSKRLRLFGVNLECQAAEESKPANATPLDSPMSTQTQNNYYPYHHPHHHYYSNYMEDTYRQG